MHLGNGIQPFSAESRYYDPEIGRFINADSYASTDVTGLLSTNMFAYCENDPVNRSDPSGEFLGTLIGAAAGGVCCAIGALITGDDWKAAAINGAVSGAITGFVADAVILTGGSAIGVVAAYAMGGTFGGALGNIAEAKYKGEKVNLRSVGKDAIVGGIFDTLGGSTVSKVIPMMEKMTQSAGKKALARGITVKYAIKKTIRNEYKNAGSTFIEECLGNFMSWYSELRVFGGKEK